LGPIVAIKKSKSLKKYKKEHPEFNAGENNSRYDKTIHVWYNIDTLDVFTGTKFQLAKKINAKRSQVLNDVITGKRNIYKGWILYSRKDVIDRNYLKEKKIKNNSNYNHTLYSFEHVSGITENNITQNDFKKKYNLSHSALSMICSGKRNMHKGWKILK